MPKNVLPHYKSHLFLALVSTLFCFVFTYLFFGFYFVEYEGLNTALLSSALTPDIIFRSVYFSGNLVISYFYSLFYEFLPGIQWISWFEYLWMYVACTVCLFVLLTCLPEGLSIKIKILLTVAVYILVFADHLVHLIYTRVAYLVCGVSLISMVVFFADKSTIKKKCWLFIFLNLFFVVGTLIRNEAAIACFLLVLTFALFYLKSIRQTMLLFAFPLIIVAGQSLFLILDIHTAGTEEFYKQVEPDIEEQFIARNNLKPLSMMETHRDSAIYGLAKEMSLSDPRIMTPEYLRSMIMPENFMFTDSRQWSRAADELNNIIRQYWYLVLISVMLSIALFIQLYAGVNKQSLFLLIFTSSFWVLTIVQAYVDKVNERSWAPYIGLFILCHILLLAKNTNVRFRPVLFILFTLCGIFCFILVYQLKKESARLMDDVAFHKQQSDKIKSVVANNILVINSSSFNSLFLSNTPFQLFDFSSFKRIYITDSYIIPFLPYYRRYLEKECACNIYDYPSIWKYIKSRKAEVVIVSSSRHIRSIQKYLKDIHGLALPLKNLPMANNNNSDWDAWKIEE
jgi:hypothetical protein